MPSTDLQVAHGDPRKSGGRQRRRPGRRPVVSDVDDAADDVDAVRVERDAEKRVEQKQLTDNVDQIEAFDDQVGDDEVVAATATARAAQAAR